MIVDKLIKSVICLILGGGRGTRLYPLTKDRSKSAVPIGGKYRMIDIPVSNSLNSGLNRILILTQFNSASLNQHINRTYRFDHFHEGFVDILAAEQTEDHLGWHQGTADAVRWNMKHITRFHDVQYALILGGDQIYAMDFRDLIKTHIENNADLTMAAIPVTRQQAPRFGILQVKGNQIVHFVEKPKDENQLDVLTISEEVRSRFENLHPQKTHLASMGIYLFNLKILQDELDLGGQDFGLDIIPRAIKNRRVCFFPFDDYWEDVGTIQSFHASNLDFVEAFPRFDFYKHRIYTNARQLPPAKIFGCLLDRVYASEGCILDRIKATRSIIGIRAIVREGTTIEDSILMGADFYDEQTDSEAIRQGLIPLGIGKNCIIKNAIIDKNARLGDNVRLVNKEGLKYADGDYYSIRDGIIVIPKNTIVPSNTVI
jgi:glucose-1-phosphate adenylyltransferase